MIERSIADEFTSRIDAELMSVVTPREMQLYRMMSYHMGWNDIAGRPDPCPTRERTHGVLCLLACRAVGGDVDAALPVAAAV